MSRSLRLLLFILFSSIQAHAIDAVLSHTTFYLPDSTSGLTPYVEVAWQVNPKSLHYVRSKLKTLSATLIADVVFSSDTGIVREDEYELQTPFKNTEQEILAMNIMKLKRYGMPVGSFKMKVTLTDITDTTNRFIFNDTFSVAAPAINPLFSGIQLLDTAYYTNKENAYTKNYMVQMPLCTNFLDDRRTYIHFYCELYNTDQTIKAEYPLVLHTYISSKENQSPFPRYSKFDTIQPGQVVPLLASFKITTLPSGNYYANVSLVNGLHKQVAAHSMFFQRYNQNPEKTAEDTVAVKPITDIEHINVFDLGTTFVAKYDYAQLRAILKMLIPVADQAGYQTIKGFLKKPDELYMRYFIYNFFANENKKDPKAAWDAYADKIREVNRLFNTSTGNNGYETDRGLVYIRFGKPTERRRVENEAGANPYELWVYDVAAQQGSSKQSGNGVFLFYKPSGSIDDYTLLHSTVPGELRNPKWRNSLYTNYSGTNAVSSQAEDLIGNR